MTSPNMVEVAAAIIAQNGKYIIDQRTGRDHLQDKWEFPGGKLEPGETPEECVVREVREELGARIRVESLFQIVEHTYPERKVRIHFYSCTLLEPLILEGEALRLRSGQAAGGPTPHVRWVALDELPFYDFAEATLPVVQALFSSMEM